MIPLPRKKVSPGDSKLYESLGALIKDFRLWREMSQEALADTIGISVRALQNWEANHHSARVQNLHDLAEATGIPMQVCVALNARQPLWYSLRKRRFAYSSIEEALYSSHELLKYYEPSDDGLLTKYTTITSDKHIRMILSRHQEIYGTESLLRKGVIKAASKLLPDLNRIIFDSWGHYVGHMVCLPIKNNIYEQLKKQKTFEDYLTTERLSDIVALQEGVFFFYSLFAASAGIGYLNYISNVQYFAEIEPKTGYLLTASIVPVEGKELFDNMGMRVVETCEPKHADSAPLMYEIELDRLMKPHGPLAALQWMIGKRGRKVEPENLPDNKQPYSLRPLIRDGGKRNEQEKVARKPQNKLRTEACPNAKCSLYSKKTMGNILRNGTHHTKEGIFVQRFLCKACGKSFCSRSKSIFYGLRSPEEKVRHALDLLAEGMSTRGVGRTLGIKPDTVRSWLRAAAEQSHHF